MLVLAFNNEAEMHHPTKFEQIQTVHGRSFIDDSTNLRFREGVITRSS